MPPVRQTLKYCSFTFCPKKPVHRCLDCNCHFCPFHAATSNSWGNFWLYKESDSGVHPYSTRSKSTENDRLVHVPFSSWEFLVCKRCSHKEQRLSFEEFVDKYPFFIKWVPKNDPDLPLIWQIFCEQRAIESFAEKDKNLRIYFAQMYDPIGFEKDKIEKDLKNTLPSPFPFDDRWESAFSLAKLSA